jgi:hypothetical protein
VTDLTHASFFTGIGAFDVGFELAGFRTVSHAEVKPFSNAVLATHWPDVPNLGDINAICPTGEGEHDCAIPRADVWTGGFPCSDFSIMGLRKGLLGGNRSSLGIVFLDLVRRHRPRFVVLENVPGLLSSHSGRDLALLLDTLVDIGYGWSYRLLDARDFGLPQARRRVFVVATADPASAGAVLDDRTDGRVDVATLVRQSGAVVARGRDGAPERPPFVLGPTYSPRSDAIVRTNGDTFPLTPNNYQYIVGDHVGPVIVEQYGTVNVKQRGDGAAATIVPPGGNTGRQFIIEDDLPVVVKRIGFDGGQHSRRDGAAFTVTPLAGDRDAQYVVDEPIVIERHGHFEPQFKRDGSAYTILPVGAGGNIGQQFIVDRPGDWDDLPDVAGGDGRRLGDGGRGDRGAGARLGSLAASGSDRPADDGDDPDGPGPTPDADRVRAAAGVPGRLDDPVGGGAGNVGPQHLDSARWHVLGRTCPVPVVAWIASGVRAVIESAEETR